MILFCSLPSISFSAFPRVSREESSANREFLTFLSCMCSGRSFMNMQNRRGPNKLPCCGTPVYIAPTADSLPFSNTNLAYLKGMNQKRGRQTGYSNIPLFFAARSSDPLDQRLFLKSRNTTPTISERSIADSHMSHNADRAV